MNKYKQVFQVYNVDIFFVFIGREKKPTFQSYIGLFETFNNLFVFSSAPR
jgi:hypothetical protein